MWIMLLQKLPVKGSPPKLSMHWSYPDRTRNRFADDQKAAIEREELWGNKTDDFFYDPGLRGKEANWSKARWITYKNQSIRVFAHEFNEMTPEKMHMFLFGLEGENIPTHVMVPNSEGDAKLLADTLTGDRASYRDAALVDGATPAQAMMVAMGMDLDLIEFPPIGWYRCLRFFAEAFCVPWEMEEEDDRTGDASAYSGKTEGVECHE